MLPGTSGSDKTGSAFETLTVGAGPEDGPLRQEVGGDGGFREQGVRDMQWQCWWWRRGDLCGSGMKEKEVTDDSIFSVLPPVNFEMGTQGFLCLPL